jgi:hypothetical protein
MLTADRIADDVRELSAMVDAVRAVVVTGDLVDLSGLDVRVAHVLDTIKSLSEADRMAVKPALIALIDAVAAMESAIVEKRDAIARDLGDVAARRRAVAAYGAKPAGPKDR